LFNLGDDLIIVNKSGKVLRRYENYMSLVPKLSFAHLLVIEFKQRSHDKAFNFVVDTTGGYPAITDMKAVSGSYAVAKSANGWGILNKNGQWTLQPSKSLEPYNFDNGYAAFRSNGNYVLVDSTGKELLRDYSFINVNTNVPGLFSSRKTSVSNYEVRNALGEVLDTCLTCTYMKPFTSDLYHVNINGKDYVRAKGGKLMTPGVDFVIYTPGGFIVKNYARDSTNKINYSVAYNGFYNTAGQEVLPMKYDFITASFLPGYLYIIDENKRPLGYMNISNGKKFWEDTKK